jgi:group I intron endonuclease
MKKWTVYCHMHIETSRCYVGITSHTMMHRWNQHCSQALHSKGGRWHFPNAIRKYGKDAFSHRILEICDSLEKANLREEAWIELFETRDPQFGFNLMRGGAHIPHSLKNPWNRAEYREKQLVLAKSKWLDSSFRKNHAKSVKDALNTKEFKIQRSRKTKEQWVNPKSRIKMIHAAKMRGKDPSFCEKSKNNWKDPSFREKCSIGPKQYNDMQKSKTHCIHGHEFANENLYIDKKGRRNCRTCHKLRTRQRRLKTGMVG